MALENNAVNDLTFVSEAMARECGKCGQVTTLRWRNVATCSDHISYHMRRYDIERRRAERRLTNDPLQTTELKRFGGERRNKEGLCF